MHKKIFYVFLMLAPLMALGFTIVENSLQDIIAKLDKFTNDYPQEKIHLQLDKPYYVTGEDIWLKSYVFTAKENKPSTLSKIVYIELIDLKNEVVKKTTLAVDSGRAFGNITIPDSLNSGNYRLRAYTNYMRNFDENFFFEKYVSITNLGQKEDASKKEILKKSLAIQFFPEGGDLVYGIRSKVGFKAIDESGIGVNANGYILDNEKQKVALFSTEYSGMGSFALTPIVGENYKAVVERPDGTSYVFNLPKIAESGYALAVNSISDQAKIAVKITTSANLLKGQELSLLAQNNGTIYFTTTTKADNAVITAIIPKKRFPTGLTQFTLFAGSTPVAERLIFVNHSDQIKFNITPVTATAQGNEKPRQQVKLNGTTIKTQSEMPETDPKVQLSLFITDGNNNPLDGNFSVSITDADKVPFNEDDEVTILSNLLLTSDLKGFIEKPNYYFNPLNPDREKHLDNLLLTQGWTRFAWQDLLANKNPVLSYRIEKSIAITGQITDLKNNPAAQAKVTLISTTDGFNMILDTVADEKGKFTFDRLEIPDTVDFIVQAKTSTNSKDVKIKLDDSPKTMARTYIGNTPNMEVYLANARLQQKEIPNFITDGISLKQVNISKKKDLKPIVNVVGSKSRNGSADYVVPADRIAHETGNAFNIFNSVNGVKMQNGKIVRSMTNTISMSNNIAGKPQPMVIILDGAEVDQDVLLTTPASAVEGIEVLVSNYNTIIYDNGYWGVILITTKSGATRLSTNNVANKTYNVAKISHLGLSPIKEFYIPKFGIAESEYKEPKNTKLRSTIYWNPNLNSDVRGKAIIRLTANKKANYRIVIEGMDSYGNLGRKVYIYQN